MLFRSVVASGAGCSSIEVLVTVPSLSSSLSATVAVPVVKVEELQLSTSPYPSYTGSDAYVDMPLYKLECTSYYQHATAALLAVLSDSSQSVVTAQAAFGSSNEAVVSVDASRVTALSAGTTTLTATFDGISVTKSVEVSDTSVSVTDAVLHVGDEASAYSLVGERGSSVQAAVKLTFSDGTQFTDAVDTSTVDWFPLGELLSFSSAQPSAVTVDGAEIGRASCRERV